MCLRGCSVATAAKVQTAGESFLSQQRPMNYRVCCMSIFCCFFVLFCFEALQERVIMSTTFFEISDSSCCVFVQQENSLDGRKCCTNCRLQPNRGVTTLWTGLKNISREVATQRSCPLCFSRQFLVFCNWRRCIYILHDSIFKIDHFNVRKNKRSDDFLLLFQFSLVKLVCEELLTPFYYKENCRIFQIFSCSRCILY